MLVLLLAAALSASCPQFFVGGQEPYVPPAVTVELRDICFPGYGLEHSGVWREPVWSSEHLMGTNVPPPGTVRKDRFHTQANLPPAERAELADYRTDSAHYDRGHATPVGDFTDQAQRDDTFTLANMMAQTKTLNERIWNNIENAVRDTAKADGDVFIVTGPHVPASPPLLGGRVTIPDATWKAIYVPSTGLIGSYWAANDISNTYETITIAELTRRTGFDPFPALSDSVKGQVFDLPKPVAGGN